MIIDLGEKKAVFQGYKHIILTQNMFFKAEERSECPGENKFALLLK